jgi:hypothetical protein
MLLFLKTDNTFHRSDLVHNLKTSVRPSLFLATQIVEEGAISVFMHFDVGFGRIQAQFMQNCIFIYTVISVFISYGKNLQN